MDQVSGLRSLQDRGKVNQTECLSLNWQVFSRHTLSTYLHGLFVVLRCLFIIGHIRQEGPARASDNSSRSMLSGAAGPW
jgi:hypothetical protein